MAGINNIQAKKIKYNELIIFWIQLKFRAF